NKARRLANHSAITFDDLIEANQSGVRNLHELSEFLELNEDYVSKVLDEYFSIYGLDVIHRNYLIRFSPLSVTKLSEI
ncbi:toxin, partial [Staphylococcus aureus]|nr:toxin [Staphylococcus aureus]